MCEIHFQANNKIPCNHIQQYPEKDRNIFSLDFVLWGRTLYLSPRKWPLLCVIFQIRTGANSWIVPCDQKQMNARNWLADTWISRPIQGMRGWEWMRIHPQCPLHQPGDKKPPTVLIHLILPILWYRKIHLFKKKESCLFKKKTPINYVSGIPLAWNK